ncbi:MAG: hypothetical protein GTN78_24325 [Gemmatimonadales bacterium]|nr:hypothetical protein [Gemmatimonadales bacterium]NIR03289.1 hypothetical protein [Gemmatimonadales bacterium]NIS66969.1 hypothetical protein [Gemmatimonadales bacterium]
MYSVLVLGGLTFVAYPFFRTPALPPAGPRAAVTRRSRVLKEKDAVYAAIKDLDFEYQTGKLSEEDYLELRRGYRARALTLLRELDEVQDEPAVTDVADGSQGSVDQPRCPKCAHVNPRMSHFCELCGIALGAGPACANCRAVYGPSDQFCGVCGSPL